MLDKFDLRKPMPAHLRAQRTADQTAGAREAIRREGKEDGLFFEESDSVDAGELPDTTKPGARLHVLRWVALAWAVLAPAARIIHPPHNLTPASTIIEVHPSASMQEQPRTPRKNPRADAPAPARY